MSKETIKQKIIRLAVNKFSDMAEKDVAQIIEFTIKKKNDLESLRQRRMGDDVRDYMNTAIYLDPLPTQALEEIIQLKHREMRQRLERGTSPFSKLDRETRARLRHLPFRWIQGAASFILFSIEERKKKCTS